MNAWLCYARLIAGHPAREPARDPTAPAARLATIRLEAARNEALAHCGGDRRLAADERRKRGCDHLEGQNEVDGT